MQNDPTPEKYVELGDRRAGLGEFDEAIRHYNKALKARPGSAEINLKLAAACRSKAEGGRKEFYRQAAEALRKALKADPFNEEAHDKLILVALKDGELDELTKEYGKKAKGGEKPEFYAKYFKQACALAVMGSEPRKPLHEYKPAPFIKSFFDLIILPGATLTILAGNFGHRFRPFLLLGGCLLLFYGSYRAIMLLMTSRK